MKGTSLLTRSQRFATSLGTFEWRYGCSKERKAVNASKLLILDKISLVALAGGKQEERRQLVAQLMRNDEFRTEGTRGSTAGNGGRLQLDTRAFTTEKGGSSEFEALVITTCILMLKKEVDRMRMIQISAMAGAGSGGT